MTDHQVIRLKPARVFPLTEYNVTVLFALVTFWCLGGLFPLIFWPHSYAVIKLLEHKEFPAEQKFKFDRHMFSNEVYAYIHKFAAFYNHKIKVFDLRPKTFSNQTIKLIRLRMPNYSGRTTRKKGTILVMAGMIACLWDSVSTALDLMHKLTEECYYKVPYLLAPRDYWMLPKVNMKFSNPEENDLDVDDVGETGSCDYDWYIIPIYNPDGYDYTLSLRDTDLNKASTRKNRAYYKVPDNTQYCVGVYLDRNFGFHWGESKPGDYENYCSSSFAGKHPFSEKENQALRNFIESLYRRNEQITMFLQIHGSVERDEVLYPWRFTGVKPFNQPLLQSMVKKASHEAKRVTGTSFQYYQSGRRDFASGVVADWLMGVYRVMFVFIIEPSFEVLNSTDVPDQKLYVQKASTVVFSLLQQHHRLNDTIL